MSIFDEKLGKELKDLRVKHHYSQQYVADRLGVSRACYGFYEQGKRTVDIDTLLKLCDIYNADFNDILKSVRKYVYK